MSAIIRSIIEDKLSAYLAANLSGVTVHKGITEELRVVPLVIAYCEAAMPDPALGATPLGNYRCKINVFVYSSADDDTLATHRQRVSNVHGLMSDVNALKGLWNPNGSEGKMYACWIESDEEGMKSRNYGNLINYTMVAVLPPSPV
mgnify:FL=1|jgi:hypothetical protein